MDETLKEVESFVHAKIEKQGNIPTFYDNRIMALVGMVRSSDAVAYAKGSPSALVLSEIERYHSRIMKPRFEEPSARLGRPDDLFKQSLIPGMQTLISSQGVTCVPSWSGRPLFKTAFDFVMYPMLLAELAPKTIIEVGSGAGGGSAVWMADVAHAHGQKPRIISIDIDPIKVQDERVEFRCGDVFEITEVLPREELAQFEHPWMVIEDAHVNVSQVLEHIDVFIKPGDYLVVEDSYPKRRTLRDFLGKAQNKYLLDTDYLDMFGENSTCAMDSIFIAVDPTAHR